MFLKLYVFLLLRFGVSIVLVINGHGTRLDDILVSGLARQAALHRIAISAKRRGSPRCAPGHMAEVERQERSGASRRKAPTSSMVIPMSVPPLPTKTTPCEFGTLISPTPRSRSSIASAVTKRRSEKKSTHPAWVTNSQEDK